MSDTLESLRAEWDRVQRYGPAQYMAATLSLVNRLLAALDAVERQLRYKHEWDERITNVREDLEALLAAADAARAKTLDGFSSDPGTYVEAAKFVPRLIGALHQQLERNMRLRTAAVELFTNRLGWSEGRIPAHLLGAVLYGENDPRVRELRDATTLTCRVCGRGGLVPGGTHLCSVGAP